MLAVCQNDRNGTGFPLSYCRRGVTTDTFHTSLTALPDRRIPENYRMSKKNLRKAVEIVAGNQRLLRQAWREIHGDE